MGLRAIVIDEDHEDLKRLTELLEIYEIEVAGFGHNGKQAYQLYKKFRPDIILMDLIMPKHDRYFALKEILKFDSNAKVIILTKEVSIEVRKNIQTLGASAVFDKSEDLTILPEIINNFFKKGFLSKLGKFFQKQVF